MKRIGQRRPSSWEVGIGRVDVVAYVVISFGLSTLVHGMNYVILWVLGVTPNLMMKHKCGNTDMINKVYLQVIEKS